MEHRNFGTTGRQVAAIGQGTWYIDRGDRADAVDTLRRGIDLGLTHVDTAEMYGDAEEDRAVLRSYLRTAPDVAVPDVDLAAQFDRLVGDKPL